MDEEGPSTEAGTGQELLGFGQRFAETGFSHYLQSGELADVCIVTPSGVEHHLHSLLLSYHSEFFKKAITGVLAWCAPNLVAALTFLCVHQQQSVAVPPQVLSQKARTGAYIFTLRTRGEYGQLCSSTFIQSTSLCPSALYGAYWRLPGS